MTWKDDLNYGLAAFGLKIPDRVPVDEWAQKLTDHPTRNLLAFLSTSTLLFYYAERGRNPKVNDVYDALIYCTTNISVGYSDIFARTPVGKLVGSILMTFGPAMAAKVLDGPKPADAAAPDPRELQVQAEMLQTLKQMLARMEGAAL